MRASLSRPTSQFSLRDSRKTRTPKAVEEVIGEVFPRLSESAVAGGRRPECRPNEAHPLKNRGRLIAAVPSDRCGRAAPALASFPCTTQKSKPTSA